MSTRSGIRVPGQALAHVHRVAVATSIHPEFDQRIWRHCKSLADAGTEVTLICPWNVSRGTVKDGVRIESFRPVETRALRPLLIPIRVGRALARMESWPDIIHFHDLDLLPWMALISGIIPVVYDIHENYPEEMLVKAWLPKIIRRPLFHLVKHVQFGLALVVRHLVIVVDYQRRHLPTSCFTIILRNYATRDLLPKVTDDYAQRGRLVVFTGSGYPENGIFLLIDIAQYVTRHVPDVRFIVADRFATPALRSEFQSRVSAAGLSDSISLFGRVPPQEIMSVINRCAVGIVPCLRVEKTEMAIPTKVFEYMAAGVPMVASDLPYLVQVLKDTEAGLVAPPEDAAKFGAAIVCLLRDKMMARSMGRAGKRAFESRYCWEAQVPDLMRFYAEIVNASSRPAV